MTVPNHVAIILDGNRRWALSNSLPRLQGHKAGADATLKLLEHARKIGVKVMTLWAFSTENWKRDVKEVEYIMDLLHKYAQSQKDRFINEQVRFRHLGRKDRLPKKILDIIEEVEEKTKNSEGLTLCMAIDYGGRDEILRTVQKIVESGINAKDITEQTISDNLDTHGIPEPDMMIRTGGEQRLSGYLPWQLVYSELFFVPYLLPDLTPARFDGLIEEFGQRERRFGGNSKGIDYDKVGK